MAYTAIDDPEAYFQVKLYAGDSTNHAITLDGDTDMQPDFVWIKETDDAINHYVFDSVRGVGKKLSPNTSSAESDSDSTWFASFDSDGFSIGSEDNINDTGDNYVAWCWKESATSGFDILTYTGTGSDASISHSLSAIPQMIIVKTRSATDGWHVYHESMGNDKNIKLNLTAANYTSNNWKKVDPTSSVFYLKSGTYDTNIDTRTYVAYLFAAKQGFSKFGSYEGNGNADGTFVYTGFRPAFLMFKNADAGSSNWQIYDNKRHGYNSANELFRANANNAGADVDPIDILSNGFKQLNTAASNNVSGQTYIYMAFAEAPFVNSNGVPCNAR